MGSIAHMPPTLQRPTRRFPRGLCVDCQQPAIDHYDTSGGFLLGCPKPGQPMFARQLAASAHIEALGAMLAIAHWKLEGWQGPPLPLGGELKRIYEGHAEYAVRFCSESARHEAESRAVSHALSAVGKALCAVQFTPDTIAEGVRTAIREALDIYRHSLMKGTASPVEMAEIVEAVSAE